MRKFLRILTSKALLTAVLMVLQFAILTLLLLYALQDTWVYILCLFIVSALFGFYILNADMHSMYKLVWLVLVLILPVVGVFAYLILGRNSKKNRRMHRYASHSQACNRFLVQDDELKTEIARRDPDFARVADYMEKTIYFPAYACTDAVYFPCGEEFFEAFKAELKKAQKFIFLEYFIVSEGRVFDQLMEILIDRVEAGVDVRLIYDDYGTFLTLPPTVRSYIKKAGVKTMVFNRFRPFLDMTQNNRTHRKIAVIDGLVGFTGGINLSDEYMNITVRHGYWKDTAVMVKGACVANFTAMFLNTWTYDHHEENMAQFFPEIAPERDTDSYALPFTDVPIDNTNTAEDLYLKLIYNAKKYIYITTPYLLIDEEMKRAIITASKSGVDVKLIVPHVPDKKTVYALTKAFFSELVKEGVAVYEYLPGFIHAKQIVCDDRYCFVGTVNMDFRSFFLHYEDGVFFANNKLAADIKADMDKVLSHSSLITKDKIKVKLHSRIWRGLLRLVAPLM